MKDYEPKWKEPNKKLHEAFDEGCFDMLSEYVEENMLTLESVITSPDLPSYTGMLKYGSSLQEDFRNFLERLHDKVWFTAYKMGTLEGMLKAASRVSTEETQDMLCLKDVMEVKSHIPHLDTVIRALKKQGHMDLTEIQKAEGIDGVIDLPQLDKMLENMQAVGLITIRRIGNYLSHSLTDMGLRYADILKRLETYNN